MTVTVFVLRRRVTVTVRASSSSSSQGSTLRWAMAEREKASSRREAVLILSDVVDDGKKETGEARAQRSGEVGREEWVSGRGTRARRRVLVS